MKSQAVSGPAGYKEPRVAAKNEERRMYRLKKCESHKNSDGHTSNWSSPEPFKRARDAARINQPLAAVGVSSTGRPAQMQGGE